MGEIIKNSKIISVLRRRMMAFFAAAALSLLAVCPQVFAADEEAYFGSEEYFWEYGETSPIGVYAASSDTIESVVMTVSYDPDALEFIDGGTLTDVSGIIEVTADDIDDTVYKRLLYFTPITGGTTYITIESIEITDEDGNTATTEAVQMAIEVLVDGEIVINFSEDEAESETETESETEEETSEEETETETETVEETTQEEAGFFEEVLINHTTLSTIVALVVVVIIIDIVVTVRTERKRRRRRGKKQKKAAQKSAGGEDSVWGAMDKGASEESVKVDSAEPPAEIPAVQEKPTDNRKTIISVSHVTMEFKRDKDESTSLKELIIRMIKGQRQVITFRALDDISFTVKEGEVVGIIGTNGSGKSTILKIISGALSPSKGKVKVDRRKVQLLTLGTGFDRELTGRENVYLNGAIIGYSKQFIDEHFDSIVEFAELEGFMDEKVRNYSSGMVSRLGFAIATAGDTPEILMLDEVLSVGDMFFKQKSEARIQEMIHSGSTVIIVSHSMGVIKKNCTKVLWIEKSHLMMTGDPETVCKAYEQMNKKEK